KRSRLDRSRGFFGARPAAARPARGQSRWKMARRGERGGSMTLRITLTGIALLVSLGCGQAAPKQAAQRKDTLTTRQRQERISAMPIQGARGVGRALQVSDSGAARAAS